VILSFLKFERFPLFVPDRSLLQPSTVSGRLHERSMNDFRRFRPFVTFLRPEEFENGHETFRKGPERP
jgi:hypothetical protein